MAKNEISNKQKDQIRKKAEETELKIKRAEEYAKSYQKQFHEEAESYIQIINKNTEECKQKTEEHAEQHKGIINSLQRGILSGDVNATKKLLEKLGK